MRRPSWCRVSATPCAWSWTTTRRGPAVPLLRGAGCGVGSRGGRRGRDAHRVSRRARSSGCSPWWPARYPDLWTGAKGFYKVEPVVADGGEVVAVRAAHHRDRRHAPRIVEIGYHCRDFFLAHWDRYRDVPRGELAHCHPPLRRGDLRRRCGRAPARPGDPRHRHPRGRRPTGRTSATSTPTPSTRPGGQPTPSAWSCPTPARCSTGSGRPGAAPLTRRGKPRRSGPGWRRASWPARGTRPAG